MTKKEQAQTTQLQTTKQTHFCETERRGQYSNERSGPSVETATKVGESRLTREDFGYGGSCLSYREEKTTVLQSNTAGVILSSIICT